MRQKYLTACTLDCPDACSLLVKVEDGQIRKIRGNPNHPYTSGYCCAKIQRFPRRLNSPSRLKAPLLRKGKKWQEIPWEEALSRCAEHMEPADPEYPMALLTLVKKDFMHSQILPEEHESLSPEAFVAPSTLRELGLKQGDNGAIISPLGEMSVRLKAEKGLHPSAAVVGRGPWLKYGWGSNRLVVGRFTDRPDGVAFYGQRVRVEKR